ncbi:hypothetical protein B0909_10295 [Rhizobium rhizogenes]|nr:hypothetical protein B0909_10295 [Rhizobium rhizogenes]
MWVNAESSCESRGCGLPPSALPGISPSRGEIASWQRIDHLQRCNVLRGATVLPISPLEGEMSGRTEGGEPSTLTYLATPKPLTP